MSKIHLGCWHRYIPGFIHVDLCDFDHIDYKSSVDSLPFLSDNSAELIYASHVFEYFDSAQAPLVLAEWRRVLKTGGTLRLAVPDFQALVRVYEQTGELARVIGPLFGRMKIVTPQGNSMLYHKTVYDESTLSEVLRVGGFAEIRHWEWRLTEHADIDDHSQAYFPHMQKDSGVHVSLNLEATKV